VKSVWLEAFDIRGQESQLWLSPHRFRSINQGSWFSVAITQGVDWWERDWGGNETRERARLGIEINSQ